MVKKHEWHQRLHIWVCQALFCLIGLLASSYLWSANFDNCTQNFVDTTPPDYIETKLLNRSVPLCFRGFATLYSGVSRTPLWSAEHLTRKRLSQAEEIPREDSFHSESRLPEDMQAQLSDYKGSGYDRGHVAPNADMANTNQQYDSFSLANMIPQAPRNNRYVWRNLESMTRYLTKKHGEVYVITGAVFKGRKIEQLNGRVLVPTHIFKALYIPSINAAGAYYAPNDDTERVEVISMDELALRSGIDAFPTITSEAKATALDLPINMDDMNQNDSNNNDTHQNKDEPLWYLILIEILRWLVDNFIKK